MTFKTKRKGTKLTIFGFVGKKCIGRAIVTLCVWNQHTASVSDVFVLPTERRKGYGTELVRECMKQALAFSNIKRIWIMDGSEHRQTSKIAEKLGFNNPQKDQFIVWTYNV